MHTFSDTAAGVPAFLAKLWRLVEDPGTNNLIYWQSDGRSFIIQNQAQFARDLLPLNYKHNNMASFIRQLNMYGFHKISSIDNGGLKFDRDEMEFSHPCFQQGHPYLLEHIKRKIANPKQPTAAATAVEEKSASLKPETVNKVMNEVKVMRNRQETLDSRFSSMKQENEALWREIAVLRQKHIKQQQIVNKLIQFLVTLVQPSRGGGGINAMNGVKRRFQLMINDVPESSKVRKPNEDTSGPVIHELDEDIFDDSNYDYGATDEGQSTSPNVLSPEYEPSNHDEENVDDISSPKMFKIEQPRTVDQFDHEDDSNDHDGMIQINENNPNQIEYIIDEIAVPDSMNAQEAADKVWQENNYLKPKIKKEATYVSKREIPSYHKNIILKPAAVQTTPPQKPSGKSLLNTQKLKGAAVKKNVPLHLKINNPKSKFSGKFMQSSVGPNKIVMRPATTATATTQLTSSSSPGRTRSTATATIPAKKLPKIYTNKTDFISTEMPNELFDSQDSSSTGGGNGGAKSPMTGDFNLAAGSFNPTLGGNYMRKFDTTPGKNMSLAKYNNSGNNGGKLTNDELMRLNSPEDVNVALDTIQGDIDSLKELFKNDDYTLDANSLMSSPGSSSKNRFLLSPTVDSELFSKIFGELDSPFGLSMNSDFSAMDKRNDDMMGGSSSATAGTSGTELMTYQQPNNTLDLFELMDSQIENEETCQQKKPVDEDSNIDNYVDDYEELNTPSCVDNPKILFKTK